MALAIGSVLYVGVRHGQVSLHYLHIVIAGLITVATAMARNKASGAASPSF